MSHQAPHASSFETSRFCLRLQELADANGSTKALKTLWLATESLVSHAEAISDQIVRHLPQFTLHNGTHLWNVLSFMEELAGGQQAIAKLGAGDCAMAVWVAFIHDLGMVLEASELAALDAVDHYDTSPDVQRNPTTWSDQRVQDWRAYRDGHEHWSAIRQEPLSDKSRMKLGIIRAAFIRDSHARHDTHSGHCRIADRLTLIAKGDRLIDQALEDFSLNERIVRVAVSHNQDIAWLPRQLSALGCDAPHAEHDAELGTIHWTWIGWLLRLADVFDCDASRTPRILFEHAGITDQRSRTEWQKHLAIRNPPTWQAGNDHQSLIYTCHLSPSPIVEKALHQIIGWMNDEISKCRAAWNALSNTQRQGIELALPSEARPDIKKRADDYLYQDIEFRLDRDAVVELLMGESLYGGPELALRELVQNALDAVHLRDQRNKLAIALEKSGNQERARQPHELWGADTGKVNVTWGTEPDGRSWIKVQDNGVGMTVATMRRFLTRIGKSYYKSDDFHAEQELMRRHGILCTAISQFGIGFLSVFMLADHVEIHTRPVGATDHPDKTKPNWQDTERFPFRADIHGPHGLLAFYPHDVRQTGTTVTLWLKEKFLLAEWDRELAISAVRRELYEAWPPGAEESRPIDELNPGYEIARFVIWPLYPVVVGPESSTMVIDDSFHFAEVVEPDFDYARQSAVEFGEALPELDDIGLKSCDWSDEDSLTGTGSRIRIIAAVPGAASWTGKTPSEWCSIGDNLPSGRQRLLISTFGEAAVGSFFVCLVNGIRVPAYDPNARSMDFNASPPIAEVIQHSPVLNGAGGIMWVDLRGAAAPRLRADRNGPTKAQSPEWQVGSLFERWIQDWSPDIPRWIATLVISPRLSSRCKVSEGNVRLVLPGMSVQSMCAIWRIEQTKVNTRPQPGPRSKRLGPVRDYGLSDHGRGSFPMYPMLTRRIQGWLKLSKHLKLYDVNHEEVPPNDWMAQVNQFASIWMNDETARQLDREASIFDSIIFFKRKPRWSLFRALVETHVASEGLWPSVAESLPAMGLSNSSIHLSDMSLSGPLHFDVQQNSSASWLDHYHVTSPFTGIPLQRLQRAFPNWVNDRKWRALFMMPFLFGAHFMPVSRDLRFPTCNSAFDFLMLFMPNPDHYEWLFAEHTQEEWNQGSASALWDLKTGEVLYADGIHTEASLRSEGQPLKEWLGIQ